MSRQNTVPSSDNPNENVSALIPLWDMFNHRSGRVSRLLETIYSCKKNTALVMDVCLIIDLLINDYNISTIIL